MERSRISKRILRFSLGTIAILLGFGVASSILSRLRQSPPEPPSSILFETDIAYTNVEGKPLLLDLARPKTGTGPFPGILCIHGGGWRAGDKKEFLGAVFALAQQGYVAATVNYRLVPDNHFPSQIQDVKTAVRYLRSRAGELHIDPDRIGVFGGSAGGHLALLLGTTDAQDFLPVGEYPGLSSSVQAVVSLAGPTDLTQRFPDASEGLITGLIGKSRAEAPGVYEQASALHHVSATDASVLAIHGTKDELVPYAQSTALVAALENVGVEVELLTIPDGGHGSGGKPEDWNAGIVKMVDFFDKHLKPASTAPPRPMP
jgi:acetyl esterase/lipase